MEQQSSTDKAQLIYVADPMCSWCYGFAPEYTRVVNYFKTEVDFKLIMGGLRPYNTETIDDNMHHFLRKHWLEISERTGQPFSYDILEDSTFVYDTEPAARAVVVVRNLKPQEEFNYYKAVQAAFYAENKNTNETETFVTIAEQFNIKANDFRTKFESKEYKDLTRQDFINAQEMGVRGFPSVLLIQGDKLSVITNGYTGAENIIRKIDAMIK